MNLMESFFKKDQSHVQQKLTKKVSFFPEDDSLRSSNSNNRKKQFSQDQKKSSKSAIRNIQEEFDEPSIKSELKNIQGVFGSSIKSVQKKQKKQKVRPQKVSSSDLIPCLFSYIKKVKVLPTQLVPHLQKRLKKYDSRNQSLYYPFYPKDLNFVVRTQQGKRGVQELINYLQILQSKQTAQIVKEVQVQWSNQLYKAAMKRVEAIQNGNPAIQALDIGELVNQFTYWKNPLTEIIVYGFIDPKQILIQAFLEDNSKEKNNRTQFFNQSARYVGIDVGRHKEYQVVTVIIFSGGVSKLTVPTHIHSQNRQCQCKIY